MPLLVVAFGAGLARQITEPWTGMHDWNGALYSQFARNLLRYPSAIHHGMPLVAVGDSTPPPEERSIYANHPPGLAWLVAAAFWALGESEWAARLIPILASLGTLWLLVRWMERLADRETAMMAGAIYLIMPMTVYFGRMVDHEAVCLFFIVLACAMFGESSTLGAVARRPVVRVIAWATAVGCATWLDWPGLLAAGLFSLHAVIEWRRGVFKLNRMVVICSVCLVVCAGLVTYLVHAGLDGHWAVLAELLRSRAGTHLAKPAPDALRHTMDNLTPPILAFVVLGLARETFIHLRKHRAASPGRTGDRVRRPLSCWWILTCTGVVWLALFWRQYRIHNYWLFYLGPAVALCAARGLLTFRDLQRWTGSTISWGLVALALAGFAWRGLARTEEYFSRVDCPLEWIEVWKEVRRLTPAAGQVVLPTSPIVEEDFGPYRFRNIVPPQLAYYLDRRFVVSAGGPPRVDDDP